MNPWFRGVLIALLGLAGSAGFVLTIFNLLMAPDSNPVGLGFFLLYLVVGIGLFRISPAWPKFSGTSVWWVVSCLVWGGFVCLPLLMFTADAWTSIAEKTNSELFAFSFAGAYPEEALKGLGTLLILCSFRSLNRPWHGFVTGGLVGLGFETVENLGYGAIGGMFDPNSDVTGALHMWGMRSMAGPGLHLMFTSFVGLGLGLALLTAGASMGWRIRAALSFWVLAFCCHFTWNIDWGGGTTETVAYVSLGIAFVVFFFYLYWRYWKAARADQEAGAHITVNRQLGTLEEALAYQTN